ncbi:uncharacterized protein LOC123037343 isoform X2 [Drosophila rhopaloa]|uniref:Uncharacterized protein n=1 Tax=Drosophila rhopaloa TaxID=1041015 RepID=A0ABM5J3K5_DRORH|nr:uncharacterized protein LOC123037343 isoform X2 [Drosophila rhopaloa]
MSTKHTKKPELAPHAPDGEEFYRAKANSMVRQLAALNLFLTEEQLQVRLDLIERIYSDFDSSRLNLERLVIEELESDARLTFTTAYCETKGRICRHLNSEKRKSLANSTELHGILGGHTAAFKCNSRPTRLPEFQLPRFGGAYIDWPDFFAMFNTVVGKNEDLTKVEKFQHLRACLDGIALDAIRSLEPTENNYDRALELLTSRFDNKLLHFQAHVRSLFKLPGVEKGSASSLRQLSDKANSHLRDLATMASTKEIYDGLLIHLIVSKLDIQTQERWEEWLPSKELPNWDKFSSFLDLRCRMMENLEYAMKTQMILVFLRLHTFSLDLHSPQCMSLMSPI